jgi:plastocyanin
MQLSSIITAIALAASVHAVPGVVKVGSIIGGVMEGYGPPMKDSNAPSMASSWPSAAPSTAPSAPSGRTQYVTVGGSAGLVYSPECVFANVGDVIVFNYGTKNHTLTQSSFAEPCTEMSAGITQIYFTNLRNTIWIYAYRR